MLEKILTKDEIEYVSKFISVPVGALTDDEAFDFIDKIQDLTTQHVRNGDKDAHYLNDIADKVSENL